MVDRLGLLPRGAATVLVGTLYGSVDVHPYCSCLSLGPRLHHYCNTLAHHRIQTINLHPLLPTRIPRLHPQRHRRWRSAPSQSASYHGRQSH